MTDRNKLLKKITFYFIIIAILLNFLAISINKYFFYDDFKKTVFNHSKESIYYKESLLNKYLFTIKNEMIFLKNLSLFKNFLNDSYEEKELEEFFKSYLHHNNNFIDIKFVDKEGLEKLNFQKYPYNINTKNLNKKTDDDYLEYINNNITKNNFYTQIYDNKNSIILKTILTIREENGDFLGLFITEVSFNDFIEELTNDILYDSLLYDDSGKILFSSKNDKNTFEENIISIYPKQYKKILSNNLIIEEDFISKKFDINITKGLNLLLELKDSYIEAQNDKNFKQELVFSIFTYFSITIFLFLVLYFTIKYYRKINDYQKQLLEQSLKTVDDYILYSKTDLKGNITFASKGFCNISGYTKDELIGKPHSILRHQDMKAEFFEELWKKIKQKKKWSGEVKNKRKDNSFYWLYTNIAPEFDEYGKHIGYVSIRQDITANKELEKQNLLLEKSISKNKRLLEASEEGKLVLDKDLNIIDYNSNIFLMFKEIENVSNVFEFFKSIEEKEYLRLSNFFYNVMKKVKSNYEIINTNGKYYKINIKSLDNENRLLIISDITDFKKQEIYFQTILNTSSSIILTTDGLELKNINKKFFDIFDYKDFEDFKSKHNTISELFIQKEPFYVSSNKEGKSWIEQLENTPKESTLGINKVCMIDKYGHERIFSIQSSGRVFDKENEEVITLTEITIIIKNRKLLEQQTKHAAMGEMISMVAHQWRQPLTILSSILAKLKVMYHMDMLSEQMINESFSKSNNILQHLSQTLNDFRNFFHKDQIEENISIPSLINKSSMIIKTNLSENEIEFIEEYSDEIKNFELKISISKFTQVFLNLIKNACDAILEKNPEKRFIKIDASKKDDDLIIHFEDSAGGIPNEIIEKIFEPYFSTKDFNGTGLGLYMSKMIVENHLKGVLSVENSQNGALFTIKLPKKLIKEK